ncbi:hypothetical protein L2E82_27119 [Cichorium intybus]|uniref:Uncharacterized protein n=2 Tax=Cichorium intybus TaxID=13427 RepID=A0ACB8ZV39_CICIN|nr:hypothetical protein L2E82_46002 [Cichorium intybus]KAI3737124.1 hypothetical protein L2E82_27119 [Cichorium intybus]
MKLPSGTMVECDCGSAAIIRTSQTKRNPGRAYYACPKMGARNGFIGWVDEEKLHSKAEIENRYLKELEKENRNLKICLICSWVLFVCILLYKL